MTDPRLPAGGFVPPIDTTEVDAKLEAALDKFLTGASEPRRACPRKGCYLPQAHDENVHGMRMPATTNREIRRGNPTRSRRRR